MMPGQRGKLAGKDTGRNQCRGLLHLQWKSTSRGWHGFYGREAKEDIPGQTHKGKQTHPAPRTQTGGRAGKQVGHLNRKLKPWEHHVKNTARTLTEGATTAQQLQVVLARLASHMEVLAQGLAAPLLNQLPAQAPDGMNKCGT